MPTEDRSILAVCEDRRASLTPKSSFYFIFNLVGTCVKNVTFAATQS